MTYKHLTIEDGRVIFLGYELHLTPSEKQILSIVAEGGATSSELLARITRLRRVGLSNVAAHISAINKKAKEIGSRRLIVNQKGKYILNEFM